MSASWSKVRSIMTLTSEWVSLFCETWKKPGGEVCDYWRVEKPDSLIIIPIYQSQFVLPPPEFRPGVGKATLDFPGGRISESEMYDIGSAVVGILCRELGIQPKSVKRVDCVDHTGTIVNSSFNNQRLLLAVAELTDIEGIHPEAAFYPLDQWQTLFQQFECLQCAFALLRFKAILE